MHADEIDVDDALVRMLLKEQFPRWADLPIARAPASGTDHAMYRLGDEMVVRLPRLERITPQVQKEQDWLPRLAPHLPLAVPALLAKGHPGAGYPCPWSIYGWLEGESASQAMLNNPEAAARTIAHFLAALQRISPHGGPYPGDHNFNRGEPLIKRDAATRQAIAALEGQIDTETVTLIWETALHAPLWTAPPVWIHGDMMSGNLLIQDGQISAIIDFGGLGIGDPACDLQIAWNFLPAQARSTFRHALQVDDATWLRGRGWALTNALVALPYYRDTNPAFARSAQHTIDEIIADHLNEDTGG